MIARHELAAAVSANDAHLDDGGNLPDLMASLGLDIEGADHVAFQRALRALAVHRGGDPAVWGMIATTGGLTDEQRNLLDIMAACFLDGLAAHAQATAPIAH